MRYTSGPGFDSRWQINIFNSVLFKKHVKEREYYNLIMFYMAGVYHLHIPEILSQLDYPCPMWH